MAVQGHLALHDRDAATLLQGGQEGAWLKGQFGIDPAGLLGWLDGKGSAPTAADTPVTRPVVSWPHRGCPVW